MGSSKFSILDKNCPTRKFSYSFPTAQNLTAFPAHGATDQTLCDKTVWWQKLNSL